MENLIKAAADYLLAQESKRKAEHDHEVRERRADKAAENFGETTLKPMLRRISDVLAEQGIQTSVTMTLQEGKSCRQRYVCGISLGDQPILGVYIDGHEGSLILIPLYANSEVRHCLFADLNQEMLNERVAEGLNSLAEHTKAST